MKRTVKGLYHLIASALLYGLVIAAAWIGWIFQTLPDAKLITTYRPEQATEVLDRNGIVITPLSDTEFRIWAPLADISPNLQMAVIAAEDDTFFFHEGINYKAAWDALKEDLKKKRYARGGSTITQQLVKNVFLSKEKTITRKVKEALLAYRVERLLSKHRILELYLNEVEWGPGVYGAEAASRYFFDKHAAALTVSESALLAAMLVNPKRFDPGTRYERLKQRQERILDLMRVGRLITREEYDGAAAAPISFRHEKAARFSISAESCPLRLFKTAMVGIYGEERLYHAGKKIRTTLDAGLQEYVREQVAQLPDRMITRGRPARPDAPSGLLIAEQDGEILAMDCVYGSEEAAQAVELLKGLEPDSRRAYRVVAPPQIAWRRLLARS
ncbi:MAG TPA: monofunctional biosynthetic peptidoglycan transglycosylase [Nitrospiria bacterium]